MDNILIFRQPSTRDLSAFFELKFFLILIFFQVRFHAKTILPHTALTLKL